MKNFSGDESFKKTSCNMPASRRRLKSSYGPVGLPGEKAEASSSCYSPGGGTSFISKEIKLRWQWAIPLDGPQ